MPHQEIAFGQCSKPVPRQEPDRRAEAHYAGAFRGSVATLDKGQGEYARLKSREDTGVFHVTRALRTIPVGTRSRNELRLAGQQWV